MNEMQKLKRDARESELQVIERQEPGGLHVIVVGTRVVHWWPESRRKTVYVEGSGAGQSFANPARVIKLAQS